VHDQTYNSGEPQFRTESRRTHATPDPGSGRAAARSARSSGTAASVGAILSCRVGEGAGGGPAAHGSPRAGDVGARGPACRARATRRAGSGDGDDPVKVMAGASLPLALWTLRSAGSGLVRGRTARTRYDALGQLASAPSGTVRSDLGRWRRRSTERSWCVHRLPIAPVHADQHSAPRKRAALSRESLLRVNFKLEVDRSVRTLLC
jgi:hypothetical protein